MPSAKLTSLIKLLDDENDTVQSGIESALRDYHGDLSDTLLAEGIHLNTKEAMKLSSRLHPSRQATLREEWVVPFARLNAPDGDWESLESLLRSISDYLHDGITLRPSLSDQLDLLSEEAQAHCNTEAELAHFLFQSDQDNSQLTGNRLHPYDPRNADLAWCLQEGCSNPIGLSTIYMLTAQRLGMQVYGCNYPGHFLSLIDHEGHSTLVDGFHGGRLTPVKELIANHPEISQQAREAVSAPCTLSAILCRILVNLHFAFEKCGRDDDTNLIYELFVPFGHE